MGAENRITGAGNDGDAEKRFTLFFPSRPFIAGYVDNFISQRAHEAVKRFAEYVPYAPRVVRLRPTCNLNLIRQFKPNLTA